MYQVKFTKEFVSGHIKGLTYDSAMLFNNKTSAENYVAFLKKHHEKPVRAFGGADYVCINVRLFEIGEYRKLC